MKEVDQAREKVTATEQLFHEQVKSIVKELLSKLKYSDFPIEMSDRGTIRAFSFGYQAGSPLLATQDGLFHARLRNWGLIRESSIVIDSSLLEATPRLYYDYSGRVFEEVGR